MSAPATGLRAKFLVCLSIATSSNSPVILSSINCYQVLQYTVYYLLKSDYALLCPVKRERSSEPEQSDKMAPRSEERRVGKEGVGTCRYGWWRNVKKKKKQEKTE